jgi:hypothetical protein
VWSGVTAAPRDLGRPPTDRHAVLGSLGQSPVPTATRPLLAIDLAAPRTWSIMAIPSFCVPDDRDPLDHKLLTVQALLVPFGASRWHGERGTVALSDQPIRLPHLAPRTPDDVLDRVFRALLAGRSIEGAFTSPGFADAVRLMQPCRLTLRRGNDQSPVGQILGAGRVEVGPEEAAA